MYSFLLQSSPVNTDTEGTAESVHINRVSVLSGSCYPSQKKLLPQQNTKEVKEDISIVKLNFSNFQRAVIT